MLLLGGAFLDYVRVLMAIKPCLLGKTTPYFYKHRSTARQARDLYSGREVINRCSVSREKRRLQTRCYITQAQRNRRTGIKYHPWSTEIVWQLVRTVLWALHALATRSAPLEHVRPYGVHHFAASPDENRGVAVVHELL